MTGASQPHRPARRRRATRAGRRGGDSGTREAILSAARARFGDLGYDRATIRAIAADAGVDPALVHHFYGTKERLFAAAVQLPLVPGEVVRAALAPEAREPGKPLGDHLIQAIIGSWDVIEVRATFLGLLRTAVSSETAASTLREFVTDAILRQLARVPKEVTGAASGEAEFRAALVASQVLGLALTRYVLQLGPLAQADARDLAAAIGPTVDRYLTGDVGPAFMNLQ